MELAPLQALAENSGDNSITLNKDGSSQISEEEYQKMLEYRVKYLMEQINLFDKLDFHTENEDEIGEHFYHYVENDFHERLFKISLIG